jgi:hypothetical protein
MAYQIPFDTDGNLVNWVGHWMNVQWRDNYVFHDTLEYLDYEQKQNSVTFRFKGTNGEYAMSLRSFDLLVKAKRFQDNKVSGDWTFVKRGQNYLLQEAE